MRDTRTAPGYWSATKTFLLLIVIWSALVLVSLLTQREQLDRTANALARIDAIANLKKDMSIRKWASSVGGVFIREDRIKPSTSLDEAEHLVAMQANGGSLDLVSVTPIHLLLAIQETTNNAFGGRERLTSKQLRNVENAPDDWESSALDALSKGSELVTESVPKKGSHGLMRAMIPMRMEKECLECHRDTLVPVGGLRGGATISINLNAYRAAQEPAWRAIQLWHFGIWIIGLSGLLSFGYFARNRNLERARLDEERHENEMAFGAMAEGAVITDASGSILWVNDAFCRISGYEREEVLQKNPRFLKSGKHDAAFYEQLWGQLARIGHWRGELWNKRKSGEIFPEEISIQALKGPNGQVRRYISIFSDITERKRIEQELQEYREDLEQQVRRRTEELTEARDAAEAANRSKSTFLANMSHELRTPLNAVIGFSQLMEKDPALAEKQRRHVEIINHSGNHLLTLINDVLELSKIESGKTEMRTEEVNLAALLEQVIGMVRLRAEQAGLTLNLQAGDLPTTINVDPVMLRQILLNLLSNAVKFTAHGQVSLRVSHSEQADGMAHLTFKVVDTGIGIPPEDQKRIFRPFEQVGVLQQGGTGLGLSISQQYVGMMGGKLCVDSTPGQGSTFRFSIDVPCSGDTVTGNARGTVVELEPAQQGRHIMVVDDIPESRLLVRSLLEPLGFRVSEAETIKQAESAIRNEPPDLILMDWFLPDGSGLQALERLRAQAELRHTRMVMLTANALEESRQAALATGAHAFMSKPYTEEALFTMLESQLDLHFTRQQTPNPIGGTVSENDICAADLIELPPEIRAELARAAISLDQKQIVAALQKLANDYPELAKRLGEFSDMRHYQHLWQLLGILDQEK